MQPYILTKQNVLDAGVYIRQAAIDFKQTIAQLEDDARTQMNHVFEQLLDVHRKLLQTNGHGVVYNHYEINLIHKSIAMEWDKLELRQLIIKSTGDFVDHADEELSLILNHVDYILNLFAPMTEQDKVLIKVKQ